MPTSTTVRVDGECNPRFEGVQRAFEQNFQDGLEVGAAVSVTIGGRPMVDLWGGSRDTAGTTPWTRDTITNVYSTTKGMTSLCLHILVDRGLVDVEEPVATYWPEFAQAGKSAIPVKWLLSHRAGLPALRGRLPPETTYDWDAMTTALAAEEPWWEPGTTFGYHAVTFGWLVGEIVRRASGKSLGTFFREEVADRLGADFHIGLDPMHHERVAGIVAAAPPTTDTPPTPMMQAMADPNSMASLAFNNPAPIMSADVVNSAEWRGAELGAVNGHADARSLARIYGALACGGEVDGVRLLSQKVLDQVYVEQSNGNNVLTMSPMRFGLGYMLPLPEANYGRGPRAFGHQGAGGSLGYADPDKQVGFGYVMNQMGAQPDMRAARLVQAVNDALEG